MDRTTCEIEAAAKQIHDAAQSLEELDEQLERALTVAAACPDGYAEAAPSERRLLNQGLFVKLFIGEDGSVEHADMQDFFAGLLCRDETTEQEERNVVALPTAMRLDEALAATATDGAS